jgi:hypothetical protein
MVKKYEMVKTRCRPKEAVTSTLRAPAWLSTMEGSVKGVVC